MLKKLRSLSKIQWLALTLILLGLVIMIPKAKGMFDFYKEVRYAQKNNFAAGNPSPSLIRPWMSLRYIAAAYAVPQQYLWSLASNPKKKPA